MFGFYFGDLYLQKLELEKMKFKIFIWGSILFLFGLLTRAIFPNIHNGKIWSSSFFSPSFAYLLGSLGFFLLCFLFIYKFFEHKEFKQYSLVNVFSQGILFIYIYQMYVSYNLSFYLKKYFTFDTFNLAYVTFIIFMWISSYFVGVVAIYFLKQKKYVIHLKKIKK